MSTEETEIVTAMDSSLGAVGGSPEGDASAEVQLLDVSLNPNPKLAQDSGDSILSEGETPLEGPPLVKSELDGHDFLKNENKAARRASPSKRNSKRKRKNARRREKKALAAMSGEDGEGRSSEDQDPTKEGEESCGETDHDTTGTESEIDGERLILKVKVHEPIPEKTELENDKEVEVVLEKESSGLFEQKEPAALEAREEESQENIGLPEPEQTPTHSVDTLVQITKDRILTGILKPSSEIITVGEEVIFAMDLMDESAQSTVYMDALEDFDESSGISVPPCSPSSDHNINNAIEPGLRPAERQKSATKAVHFDENPPEIVSVENIPMEERVFDLSFEKDDSFTVTAGDLESLEEAVDIICSSSRNLDETFVVADTLEAVDSVNSAVSSNASAECLLKGSGSSVEVMTDNSVHFPSRETIEVQNDGEEAQEAVTMRERINVFKQEYPEEAEKIGYELDTILTLSAERLSAVMEEEEEEEEEDDQEVQVQRLEDLPEAEMWKEPSPEDRENNNETKETIFLVENIVHTDSAVSSVASASVESLLKGAGRNFEEFDQPHHHFTSREVDLDRDLIEVDLNPESSNEAPSKGTPKRPQTPKFRDAGEGDTILPLSHDRISSLKRSEIDSDSAEDSPNFLPERAESLNKILAAKQEAEDAAGDTAGSGNCSTLERKGTRKRGSRNRKDADGQGQDGCNCAKLCTIQ